MGSQYNLKKIQDLCFWEAKEGEMSCKPFFIDMGERKLKEAPDIHSFTRLRGLKRSKMIPTNQTHRDKYREREKPKEKKRKVFPFTK